MLNKKFAVPVVAGVLSISLGLAGCGGNNNASTESTETKEATTATTDPEIEEILYYEGTFENGDQIIYGVDGTKISIAIMSTTNDAVIVEGEPTYSGDKGTVKGEDGTSLTYTMTADDKGTTIEVEGYGKAELKAVTQSEFEKELAEFTSSAATASVDLNEILYYQGTFESGDTIIYGSDGSQISIAIIPANAEDAEKSIIVIAEPKFDSTTDKITLAGEDGTTLTFNLTADEAGTTTIDVDGYGKAELKAITASEFEAELANVSVSE